ncbi:piggyBac transposable element-derived protein 4-like [Aricia agestis]|uniref:piggyBac transposable element-derived protein 4-like n=1 Tax=Aricia agestis TaxID=91739 RepID=UPI001C20B496|nr:piggyBac transposable element-derived protein 4-like [Aricia agestis]
MTCRRFKKITENLHLSDRARELQRTQVGYDKLGKIRQVMDILNKSFKDLFAFFSIESQTQSIDESMIKFKGRSTMKQYMPKKPIKRGYKVWARCDSETGYLHQFNVYSGKCESNEDGDGGLGFKVVMELCRTVQADTLIAFDNFFTSLPLMEMLHRKKIYAVGTVRVNRKGLPTCLLPHKGDKRENKLKIGEFMLQYADPVSVIKWRDTKDVYICTTAYDPKKVVTIHRTQKDGQKAPMICPYAIEQYTRNMGGVDRLDHFRSSYSIGRKSTKKNWLRLFWVMLEVACINAYYIMYSMTHKTSSSSHKEFRLRLARNLINNFSTRIRDHVIFKNKRGGQYGVADEVRIRNVGHHMPYNAATRKRCRFCSIKKEVKRSKIICKVIKVTLCATPCFENFHK